MEPRLKDDSYEVSDPTDWLGTPLSSLMQVEQSLRCHVCKEFFDSPMITSCCHTFCSLCIRRALNTDGKCPLCRATDQESKLRGNWALREASESFVASRQVMLDLSRRPTASATTLPKRKANEGPVSDESANKRTRRSTRSKTAKAVANTADVIQEDYSGLEQEEEEEEEYIPDDGLVECPICTWRMKAEKVSTHMDTDCPGEPRPQPKPSKSTKFGLVSIQSAGTLPGATYERLASTNYSILNETKLRKKLENAGIPTWGTKPLMERRHKEWVMIWNANCDSSRPKTKHKLLQDLNTWEQTQGGHASTSSVSTHLGAQIKDKDFDGAGWSSKHNDSFGDLIAQARKSRKAAEKPRPSSPSADRTGASPSRINGADSGEFPAASETDKLPPSQVPVNNSVAVNLTSPVRFDSGRDGSHRSNDEHTSVDTVVASAFIGTHL